MSGSVISPSFRGMRDSERQRRIWDARCAEYEDRSRWNSWVRCWPLLPMNGISTATQTPAEAAAGKNTSLMYSVPMNSRVGIPSSASRGLLRRLASAGGPQKIFWGGRFSRLFGRRGRKLPNPSTVRTCAFLAYSPRTGWRKTPAKNFFSPKSAWGKDLRRQAFNSI